MGKGSKAVGHIATLITMLFFGLNIPALKEVMPTWFNGIDATLFRIGSAAILFWITSIFIKNKRIEHKDWLHVILSGMIGLFLFLLFFNLGVEYSSPVDISIIMTTPPIMVVIASAIIFKHKLSTLKIVGVIMALAGALMVILIQHHGSGVTRTLKGNIFGILSSFSYAYYLIILQKLAPKYHPVTLLRWLFLFASIVCIPVCLSSAIHAELFVRPEWKPWLILTFVILCPTFIAYLLIPIAVRRIGNELVSMYQYLIPVIASVAAIALGLDRLFWDQPVAAGIIIAGVILASIGDKHEQALKAKKEAEATPNATPPVNKATTHAKPKEPTP